MLAEGTVVSFIVLVGYLVFAYMTMQKYNGRKDFPIKRLKGLDFIDDALGRVTEMGKPAHFAMGSGSSLGAQHFAAFEYLRYIAHKTAMYDAQLIVTNAIPEVQPVTEEIVRTAYVAAGKVESYKPDNIRYVSVYALRPAVLGTFEREKVAASFVLGDIYHESVIFVEAASSVGAISIGGTTQTAQIPFFVAGADYTLIGEEFYAGSTFLSGNVAHFGCLTAQEIGKYVAIFIILLGSIMVTSGNEFFINLMTK
jgi:hypothetical protein